MNAKDLQQERIDIFHDVYDSRIPKRVPVNISLLFEVIAQFGNLNLSNAQWNPELIYEAADAMCQTVYSDVCPFMGSFRYPSYYQILKSQSFVMASNGFIQHPEVMGLQLEDYDYLIEKPYECIVERVLPRLYNAIDWDEPINTAFTLLKAFYAYNNEFAQVNRVIQSLIQKYGYYPKDPQNYGFTQTPFDFLADQLRGFKGISKDIRKIPDKIEQACQALYPLAFAKGLPKEISKYSYVFIPLHMPAFMREKDFERLYWPTFKKMVEEYSSLGLRCTLFCEHDWDRYLDYLYELPDGTVLMFEYGDPKLIKEKLGKKHIITGLYPLVNLKTKSPEQCADEAKRYIDILAPGGKYIFGFDKSPLSLSDLNIESLRAVAGTVRDYGVYGNARNATAACGFTKRQYEAKPPKVLKSKYLMSWDQYKLDGKLSDFAQRKLEYIEDGVFEFIMFLLL